LTFGLVARVGGIVEGAQSRERATVIVIDRPLRSASGRLLRRRGLTLTVIKLTFSLAVDAATNVGNAWDG
jgi:hypothetical protein